jgi:GNAT superfamily N-acetyltransferase
MTAPLTDTRPPRQSTLLAGVRIERGTHADWLALAPLHYRSARAGAVTDVFRLIYTTHGAERETKFKLGTRNAERGTQAETEETTARRRDQPPAGSNRTVFAANPAVGSFIPRSEFRVPRLLLGVIVYSRSPLSLGARDRATAGRYRTAGLGRTATGRLVNRELRIISRLVIAPNWRGLGLASLLAAATMPQVDAPYIEAMAAMGAMHPMFVRAGMTAYPQPPSPQGQRLAAALEAAGLDRTDRRSSGALGRAIDALDPAARALATREIERWARSYLGAKNHRVNRPDRRRMLDLVARHLDAMPVYYLWRRPSERQEQQPQITQSAQIENNR